MTGNDWRLHVARDTLPVTCSDTWPRDHHTCIAHSVLTPEPGGPVVGLGVPGADTHGLHLDQDLAWSGLGDRHLLITVVL